MNKQQLQQEIEALQKQLEEKQKALAAMPDKWEPKSGRYYVSLEGVVREASSTGNFRFFGVEYATRQQAEKAAKAMRAHNRSLAYVAEFAPDWEPVGYEEKWFVYFDLVSNRWDCECHTDIKISGVVYMPFKVANDLFHKLNSGEVEL